MLKITGFYAGGLSGGWVKTGENSQIIIVAAIVISNNNPKSTAIASVTALQQENMLGENKET